MFFKKNKEISQSKTSDIIREQIINEDAAKEENNELQNRLTDAISILQDIKNGIWDREIDDEESRDIIKELQEVILYINNHIGEIKISSETTKDSAASLNSNAKNSMLKAKDIYEMTGDIAKSTEELNSRINSISAASEELSVNMDAISNSSTQSENNVSQIYNSTSELKEASLEIAKSTERAASISQESIRIVKNSTELVTQLNSSVLEIASISSTISSISDQTQLLALNATIEAARAGDAGKGFAVVANEVKELSTQTNKSTESIDQMITNIQAITKQTIESIEKISQVMSEIDKAVNTIASAAEEQSVTTESIVSNINDTNNEIKVMAQSVREGAEAIREVGQNITAVSSLSEDLKNNTKQMRDSAKKIEMGSISTYASAMELGGVAHDISTFIKDIKFSQDIEDDVIAAKSSLCRFSKSYRVKVEQFDKDHIVIFNYINNLHSFIKENSSSDKILDELKALATFTREHFAREEEKFQLTNYPAYEGHKKIHTELLATVQGIVDKLTAKENLDLTEVLVFLKDWLIEHIQGVDKKYTNHLHENNIY